MSPKGPHSSYRPDIDGLRAVAVLAVVLYHAGLKVTSGGYIGVDVFFVISGYLITQFIDQRIAAGRFSILEFYERRVRRILPALFFLLLAVSVASVFILLPEDLVSFAKSEVATVAFLPNVLFYLRSGYFDTGARLKPLLHMWSLGVEEQFYIFFPPLMFLLSRLGRRGTVRAVGFITAASFALSVWTVHRGLAQAAFYLVPYRAWELLTGSLLALRALPQIKGSLLHNVVAGVGLVAVMAGIFAFSSLTPFPGLSAALPCIGTALVIYANESGPTLIGSLLSFRPFVFVGLISYSLYLWHWPILVFAEQLRSRGLTGAESAVCCLLAFIGATLSWRFVEGPFREKIVGVTRSALMSQAAVGAICLLAVALLFVRERGFDDRFPKQAVAYASSKSERDKNLDVCLKSRDIEKQAACHLGLTKTDAPHFLLWGDSHASALAPAFDKVASDSGTAGWIASGPGCLPLLDVQRVDTPGCTEFNRDVLAMVQRDNIPAIILAGRWALASLGLTDLELHEGRSQIMLFDSFTKTRSLQENAAVFDRGLRRLLSDPAMQGRKITLVIDLPDTGVDTPRYLAHSVMWKEAAKASQEVQLSISPYSMESSRVDDQLARIAKEFHAATINPKTELCNNDRCLIARNGRSLYRDSHHLTIFGALQLVEVLRPALAASTSRERLHSQVEMPKIE
jgi:peptidoglycan/LPS O-acetylase OafA/YrhL